MTDELLDYRAIAREYVELTLHDRHPSGRVSGSSGLWLPSKDELQACCRTVKTRELHAHCRSLKHVLFRYGIFGKAGEIMVKLEIDRARTALHVAKRLRGEPVEYWDDIHGTYQVDIDFHGQLRGNK